MHSRVDASRPFTTHVKWRSFFKADVEADAVPQERMGQSTSTGRYIKHNPIAIADFLVKL
jgi:hypothetical protein